MNKLALANLPITAQHIKIFQYFIIGIVVYIILTGQIRKARQAKAYNQAGTDPNTAFAIRVRQACNPSGISMLIDVDTTHENDLMLIADELTDVDKVAKAYFNLYNENMYNRLEKELNSKRFQEWLRRAQAAPTANQASGSVGNELAAIKETPVFSDTDSSKVVKTVKAGETIGTKIGAYYITSGGVKRLYYLVQWTSFIFLVNQGFVLASDTKQI